LVTKFDIRTFVCWWCDRHYFFTLLRGVFVCAVFSCHAANYNIDQTHKAQFVLVEMLLWQLLLLFCSWHVSPNVITKASCPRGHTAPTKTERRQERWAGTVATCADTVFVILNWKKLEEAKSNLFHRRSEPVGEVDFRRLRYGLHPLLSYLPHRV